MIEKIASFRKALGALSLLWFGSLFAAGLTFLTQVILARELTPPSYGVFAAALATVTLLAPLAGFGVSGMWLKVFGAEGWQATRWLPASFSFIIASTLFTLLLLSVWAAFGPHDQSIALLLFFLLPVILGYLLTELVSSKLLLEERFRSLAFWQLLPHLLRLILVVAILMWSRRDSVVPTVAAGYALAAIIVSFVGFIILKPMAKGRISLKGHSVPLTNATGDVVRKVKSIGAVDVAAHTWPFGLASIFHLIYFQSDIILLKYISGNEVAGMYNVAFTLMVAVYLLPSVVYQKFLLPKIHRWANHDREQLYQVYRKGNLMMLLLGLAAMLTIWVLAHWAVPLLFGEQYSHAVYLLNILALSAPVLFVASSVGAPLVTQEYMKIKVKCMGLVAVLNIGLNLLLIPGFGAVGAALTTVFSNAVLLMIYYAVAQRHVFNEKIKQGC